MNRFHIECIAFWFRDGFEVYSLEYYTHDEVNACNECYREFWL